jgi:hypothetical protein
MLTGLLPSVQQRRDGGPRCVLVLIQHEQRERDLIQYDASTSPRGILVLSETRDAESHAGTRHETRSGPRDGENNTMASARRKRETATRFVATQTHTSSAHRAPSDRRRPIREKGAQDSGKVRHEVKPEKTPDLFELRAHLERMRLLLLEIAISVSVTTSNERSPQRSRWRADMQNAMRGRTLMAASCRVKRGKLQRWADQQGVIEHDSALLTWSTRNRAGQPRPRCSDPGESSANSGQAHTE